MTLNILIKVTEVISYFSRLNSAQHQHRVSEVMESIDKTGTYDLTTQVKEYYDTLKRTAMRGITECLEKNGVTHFG